MENDRNNISWPGWQIGKGSFGSVYEIHRSTAGSHVERAALKVISLPKSAEELAALRSDGYTEESLPRYFGEQLPEPLHGSEELIRIVMKACAFAPKDRYQSAQEMLRNTIFLHQQKETVLLCDTGGNAGCPE